MNPTSGRRTLLRLALAMAASVSLLFFAYGPAPATAGNFVIPVSASKTGFGSFHEGGPSAPKLSNVFGAPSSAGGDSHVCALFWRRYGLYVKVGVFGSDYSNPCYSGYFLTAWITGRRWHTASGIRIGSPARKARRHAVINCNGKRARRNIRCLRKRGYVLGLHRSECAAGRWPTVTAVIKRGRVSGFYVWSHGCE